MEYTDDYTDNVIKALTEMKKDKPYWVRMQINEAIDNHRWIVKCALESGLSVNENGEIIG